MLCIGCASVKQNQENLVFNDKQYKVETITEGGKTFQVRAYEGIVYVTKPIEKKYQQMNIYIPEAYFNGGTINGFNAETAPIFFPNKVGGYMPAEPAKLKETKTMRGKQNAVAVALSKGFVVASAGARGRTTPTGKAPAVIIDLKAAVRYLKYNDLRMPGDAEKIISNGTSAGGAISLLLGTSADNVKYINYLNEIGAAIASDKIYAVSAYCPITLLVIADSAYEWQFNGINTYKKIEASMLDYNVQRKLVEGELSEKEKEISDKLKGNFINIVNVALQIKNKSFGNLQLDELGNGSFKEMIIEELIKSAKKAQKNGTDMSQYNFLSINENEIIGLDWDKYIHYVGRMKTPPAFDALDLSSGENQLFGDAFTDRKHFTSYAYQNSTKKGELADSKITLLMNPLYFLNQDSRKATYYRIRHGSKDADTSLAISFIVSEQLKEYKCNVDYAISWDIPHSGDYDLEELFSWAIDVVSKTPTKNKIMEIKAIEE